MTIVAGYSPDPYGKAALTYAVAEAGLRAQRVLVVNATKGDAYVDPSYASRDELTALESELATLGVDHEIRQAIGPDVAEEVLSVVDEVAAELLVVGIRHRSPVGKLLLGSVAQRLLLDCPCPVLAVKPAAGDSDA